jgi:transcriptional regulator with XRE-family HTH domain
MARSDIGRRIRSLREQRGWTQMELARKAGLKSTGHVSLLQSGRRRDPSVSTLRRLAKALGVPVVALLE